MNTSEECILIYDKYGAGTHSYNNERTKNIIVKNLFENFQYIEGLDAIVEFDNLFRPYKIPNDLNFDIINVCMFKYIDDDEIEIVVTLILIRHTKMLEYYNEHRTLPNLEFLTYACIYHMNYVHNSFRETSDNTLATINEIAKNAMVPFSNIVDNLIPQPSFINLELYSYQRRNIKWMLDTEHNMKTIYYGYSSEFHLQIGEFIFDTFSKKFLSKKEQKFIKFSGGALIDEVGLGKTIQIIALSFLNPATDLSYVCASPSPMLQSRATLILCPNHLCGQWEREITGKLTRPETRIVTLTTKKNFDSVTYLELLNADFVIVSYNFVTNACVTSKYVSLLSTLKSHVASRNWNTSKALEVFTNLAKDIAVPSTLFKTETIFMLIYWHRIVIDEFHEMFPLSSTKYLGVYNIIQTLKGKHRWIVTATPFNDYVYESFESMFHFVTGEHDLHKNIVVAEQIKQYLFDDFFRRNTKKSIEEEFKLPELKEKIIWLKFSKTECMMYNAYLSDKTLAKTSVIIRQLCCHPKIADEIKNVLVDCKSLDDIQKEMVVHYETQYNSAKKDVDKCNNNVVRTEKKITIMEYKRQRKFLEQLGYRVKIEYPEFEYDENTQDQNADTEDEDNATNDDKTSSDEDNSKPLFVVSAENQDKIKKLIGNKLNNNPSATLANMYVIFLNYKHKLQEALDVLKGKESSYVFFKNMLEKIKKTTDRTNKKYERLTKRSEDSSEEDDSDDEDDEDECGICLNPIVADDIGVTSCGHIYCHACIKTSVDTLKKCPMCNKKLNITDVTKISYEIPKRGKINEIAKNKMELIDKIGTKLTNLIYYLKSIDENVIIFSQWDSLLKKVGVTLTDHGIKNVFCRGNVWMREKAIHDFMANTDIKVIMLSSELSAAGTNLTKASKVILLDPVAGSYEHRRNIEWQAIGRAYRLGQTNPVEIVRFIISDTVEEDIYKENKIEDAKQTFVHPISETTDDTITLASDKFIAITQALERSSELKQTKQKVSTKKKTKSLVE